MPAFIERFHDCESEQEHDQFHAHQDALRPGPARDPVRSASVPGEDGKPWFPISWIPAADFLRLFADRRAAGVDGILVRAGLAQRTVLFVGGEGWQSVLRPGRDGSAALWRTVPGQRGGG